MANLLLVKACVVLGARMPQGVVIRMIGLNQNFAWHDRPRPARPATCVKQLKRSFSGAKVRQRHSGIN